MQRQLECLLEDGVSENVGEGDGDAGGDVMCYLCLEKKHSARGRCGNRVCCGNEGTFVCDGCYRMQKRKRIG